MVDGYFVAGTDADAPRIGAWCGDFEVEEEKDKWWAKM